MPFYDKGNVRIRYEEVGSGFPLLVTPGGGLNSRVSNWPTAVINAMEEFKNEFRCITMDQRNANGGESSGPIPVDDPWVPSPTTSSADGSPRHPRVLLHGYASGPRCIKLIGGSRPRCGRRPLPAGRASAGDPGPHVQRGPEHLAPALLARRPDLTMENIEAYLHNLFRVQPDFVYSVSRDFVRSCQTPMLVMPDDTPGHPYQVSMDIVALAPKAEVTSIPGKSPRTSGQDVHQVRDFLKRISPWPLPTKTGGWRRSTAPPCPRAAQGECDPGHARPSPLCSWAVQSPR